MKPASLIASLFLLLVALMHLLRVIFQVPVTAGEFVVPIWMSVFATLGPGALGVWLWRERAK